jgi:hypothetical protein
MPKCPLDFAQSIFVLLILSDRVPKPGHQSLYEVTVLEMPDVPLIVFEHILTHFEQVFQCVFI